MSRYVDIEPYEDYRIAYYQEDYGFPCSELPTADVEPVKHGYWIPHYENIFTPDDVAERTLVGYKCSRCSREIDTREKDTAKVASNFPYCHCGAKMDAKEKKDERN